MSTRAFARRSLLVWAIAWVLCCGVASGGQPPTSFNEAVPAAHVQAAWNRTVQLLADQGADIPWKRFPKMAINRLYEHRDVEGENARFVGMHFLTKTIDSKGRMKFSEKIEIYLMPHEECFLEDVLVHEMLHAVHDRYQHIHVNLHVEAEAFVDHFLFGLDYRPCDQRD